MIRTFDWRDLTLVHRLAPEGLCLHAETWYTRGVNNWLSVLRASVAPGGNTTTLVLRSADEQAMFGQVAHTNGQPWAQVHYLAPQPTAENLDPWIDLLQAMVRTAGEGGAQYLVAEVDDNHPVVGALRAAGFATYTHQSIWRCQPSYDRAAGVPFSALRRKNDEDTLAVQLFYKQMVPGLVRHVEIPLNTDEGYIWQEKGEVLAYLAVSRGPLGYWVRPFVHPEVQPLLPALISGLLTQLGADEQPVYVCLRSYQGGFQGALSDNHFTPEAYQALMVKRLAVGVLVPQFDQMTVPAQTATGAFTKPPFGN